MDLTAYYNLVSKEHRARRYLTKKCLKNGRRVCPRCNAKKLYRLSDDRRRCARCRYTFHDFSGRWLNKTQLTCVQWLSVIKLFELEISTRAISDQLNINYKTVARAIGIIRQAIAENTRISLGNSTNGGSPVFGVLVKQHLPEIVIIPDLSVKAIMDLPIRKFRKGSIIYTTRYNGYESILAHGARHEMEGNGKDRFGDRNSFIEFDGFMNWVPEKFQKHRMISKQQFPYLLKELEFRYNNETERFFELTAAAICNLVPNKANPAKTGA